MKVRVKEGTTIWFRSLDGWSKTKLKASKTTTGTKVRTIAKAKGRPSLAIIAIDAGATWTHCSPQGEQEVPLLNSVEVGVPPRYLADLSTDA